MKTTIRSGKYEIVESDIFYMDHSESEVAMHLMIEDLFIGDIIIHFLTVEQVQGHKIEADIEDEVLVIKCINFSNSLGTGTSVPVKIGYINDKNIFLHLWSYLIGERGIDQENVVRKVEYSILKEI